jgi:hypothetical protein
LTAKGPDREVLVLRYLEQMSARNVAAVLAMANQRPDDDVSNALDNGEHLPLWMPTLSEIDLAISILVMPNHARPGGVAVDNESAPLIALEPLALGFLQRQAHGVDSHWPPGGSFQLFKQGEPVVVVPAAFALLYPCPRFTRFSPSSQVFVLRASLCLSPRPFMLGWRSSPILRIASRLDRCFLSGDRRPALHCGRVRFWPLSK